MRRLFPFLAWFPLKRKVLHADLVAGVTVALVLVPQSMAYAQLAGMPVHYGLYASLLPVAVGAMWGSSHQLATGPVAMVSLLTGATLSQFAAPGSEQFVAYAIALSLMVGVLQIALGAFRLGALVNLLSHPVIAGFTNAAAVIIALSQLDKLLGVSNTRSNHFLLDVFSVLGRAGEAHLPTVATGFGALAVMLALRRYAPKLPAVLISLALVAGLSWALGFERGGGAVVGRIPEGLPPIGVPRSSWDTFGTLLSAAFVITLVGFMEAISIAKAMATKTRQRVDANQELIGQGLANLASCLSSSFPVSGSFSRSAVNLSSGALTGVSSVVTAALVLVTLLFLTPLLYHLPQAALAAVIILAVVNLINFAALRHAWQAHPHDGVAASVAFVATLALAPQLDLGILAGGGLAIVLYLYRTMTPRVALLARHADATLRDAKAHGLPASERIIVLRFDGDLYFGNVPYFEDAILNAVASRPRATHLLVVGDGINEIDASGEEVIRHLVERLRENGLQVAFSGLKLQVLQVMKNTGLSVLIGEKNMFRTADQALEAIFAGQLDPVLMSPAR